MRLSLSLCLSVIFLLSHNRLLQLVVPVGILAGIAVAALLALASSRPLSFVLLATGFTRLGAHFFSDEINRQGNASHNKHEQPRPKDLGRRRIGEHIYPEFDADECLR